LLYYLLAIIYYLEKSPHRERKNKNPMGARKPKSK